MGIDQPKVSALLNGRFAHFSSDRLMRLLTTLGQDVDITVRAKPRDRAHGCIRVIGEVHPEDWTKNLAPSFVLQRRRDCRQPSMIRWSTLCQA